MDHAATQASRTGQWHRVAALLQQGLALAAVLFAAVDAGRVVTTREPQGNALTPSQSDAVEAAAPGARSNSIRC